MIEIPTNTALYIAVGPFLDKTDGITPEVSITVANSAITLIADAGSESTPTLILDSVAGNDATNTLTHITNDDGGYYYLKLTAANNNRYGTGKLVIEDVDTYVTVFHEIQWVSAAYYNWKYGTTKPTILLDSGTGTGQISLSSGTITVGTNNDKTGYGLADDAITAAKYDESTAFPLKSADTGATAVARTGADSDTLATLSGQLDTVITDTNELQTDLTNGGRLDLLIDAIKAKTDNLPASPASTTNITAGTITTVTNLTNAPTNGDFTATQKSSITAAVPTAATIKTALEADGGKLDHLWEMTEDDAGTRRLTANALEQAPSGGLDAAGIRTAIGLASANLDTQIGALPTAAENADATWDEVLSGHTGAGTAGAALSTAGSGSGTGAVTWTYTLTDSVTGLPIPGADIRITSDAAGATSLATGLTNASGMATFYLDAGTVYVWRGKAGYTFTDPDVEVVA